MSRWILFGATSVALLAFISLWIGVSEVSPAALFAPSEDGRALQVLLISRVPRTLALVLAGASMAAAQPS
jgi:iron complex transport system permease protein